MVRMVTSPPTAMITWSHADPSPDAAEQERRRQDVLALADALRRSGVDADVDLYHGHDGVDWTRWGPASLRDADYVLVVPGRRWADAWEGRGDPSVGAGAAAECDVLRTIYNDDRAAFLKRVRLVQLPGSDDTIPAGLHGPQRYRVDPSRPDHLELLLRDLTGQAAVSRPPLGPPPKFGAPPLSSSAHSPRAPGPSLEYSPLDGEVVEWWEAGKGVGTAPMLIVHGVRSTTRLSQRHLLEIKERLPRLLRDLGYVSDAEGIAVSDVANSVQVVRTQVRPAYGRVEQPRVEQVRVHPAQVSVARTLPRDQMGAVVDATDIEAGVSEALSLMAGVWNNSSLALALALEVTDTSTITDGTVDELGHRNRATMISFGQSESLRIAPDEIITFSDIGRQGPQVARTMARLLIDRLQGPLRSRFMR